MATLSLRSPLRLAALAGALSVSGDVEFESAGGILSWSASSGATGYEFYWGTASGQYIQALGEGHDVGNVLSVAISSFGLDADVTYFMVMRARDSDGVGPATPEIQVLNNVRIQ